MPKLYDITNWNQQPWVSTGGTRSKKYVQAPDGKYYYFKKSLKKPGYEYFYEFWNEIIATELGNMLGFNMLRYDLAIDGIEMGCLSESMISADGEELIEGGKYLQALENRFNPELKEARKMYSFQLIEHALTEFKLHDYIDRIVEVIIFDAVISNGDRHQENWAFVSELTLITGGLKEFEDAVKKDEHLTLPKWMLKIFGQIIDYEKKELKSEVKAAHLYLQKVKGFAPIYDSGSSLGRELSEEKIQTLLKDEQQFQAYLRRGNSEIHWDNSKLNHFDLIAKLLESSYSEIVCVTINRILERFNESNFEKMMMVIDNEVPEIFKNYKLPEARKRLIIKIITSRIQRLKSLCDERV